MVQKKEGIFSMNILEFTRSTHVRNKIVVGNYHVVQLVVNFGISTMLYVPVVARVDNLNLLNLVFFTLLVLNLVGSYMIDQ